MEFESDKSGDSFWLVFWALNPDEASQKYDTTFAIIPAAASFSRPAPEVEPEAMYGDQPYMTNLRTHDLEGLLQSLEQKAVLVIRRAEMIYGKFAWCGMRTATASSCTSPANCKGS